MEDKRQEARGARKAFERIMDEIDGTEVVGRVREHVIIVDGFISNQISAGKPPKDFPVWGECSSSDVQEWFTKNYATIRAALTAQSETVDISGLHSKIEMDLEDEIGEVIPYETSKWIGSTIDHIAENYNLTRKEK